MTCSRCHADWCWLCGESIEPGVFSSHYKAGSGSACAGKQFGGGGGEGGDQEGDVSLSQVWAHATCVERAVILLVPTLLWLSFGLAYGAVTLALFFALCVLAAFIPSADYRSRCVEHVPTVSAVVLMCLGGLTAIATCPLWLCCAQYSNERIVPRVEATRMAQRVAAAAEAGGGDADADAEEAEEEEEQEEEAAVVEE